MSAVAVESSSSAVAVRPEREAEAALVAQGLWMRYGKTVALRDIDLAVGRGTIHGLVGENGAGKSTFLSIAAGRVQPSAGTVQIYGHKLERASPRGARELGVAAIYQELAVVPAMTASANVFLGHEPTTSRVLAKASMRARYEALCDQLGVDIPGSVLARELSVADQQALEIMRGLQVDARLLLLDEPTSALGRAERVRLFETLKSLKGRGVSSIFVSHDLRDVLDLADVVTVFRDGRVVETRGASDWSRGELVGAMLGGAELARRSHARVRIDRSDPPLLAAERLVVEDALYDVSLSVGRGEVLGVAGLVGSGRTTLLRCLAGDIGKRARGELALEGRRMRVPRTPARAAHLGIAFIPENRRTQGLVLGMTALENIMLPDFQGFPLARAAKQAGERRAREAAERVGFDPARLATRAENLSGGNQQKLLLARWVSRSRVKVLLADEPTRGVDVGAKSEILQTLRLLADEGLAIIVASSELEELEAIADRTIVLAKGRVVAELHRDRNEITAERILHAAFQN